MSSYLQLKYSKCTHAAINDVIFEVCKKSSQQNGFSSVANLLVNIDIRTLAIARTSKKWKTKQTLVPFKNVSQVL